MAAPLDLSKRPGIDHTPLEDAQGLSIGVLLAAVGLSFLAHLGFLTGQMAGLALIVSYVTGFSFGPVFFALNLPFYWLAYTRLGLEFTLKTLGAVTALSVLVELLPQGMQIAYLNPVLGVVIFGVATGFGLLGIFRHNASLGGFGILAFVIQDKTGFRAGYVQLIVDAVIFAIGAFLFDLRVVAYSLLGALVLNGIIAFNHNRDRYIAK